MPNYFCNSCGHKITYETTKPASCPKCRTVFTDLTKAISTAAIAVSPIKVKSTEIERPAPKTLAQQRMLKRAALAKQTHTEEDNEEVDEEEGSLGQDDIQEDPPTTRRAVRDHMRQLAASFKGVTITIETDKDDRIGASDWCGAKE